MKAASRCGKCCQSADFNSTQSGNGNAAVRTFNSWWAEAPERAESMGGQGSQAPVTKQNHNLVYFPLNRHYSHRNSLLLTFSARKTPTHSFSLVLECHLHWAAFPTPTKGSYPLLGANKTPSTPALGGTDLMWRWPEHRQQPHRCQVHPCGPRTYPQPGHSKC